MSVLNRYERRKQTTRQQLKQAALEVIGEKGYPALTVQAITDRADLGYGTFYIHYAEKDDLVWEIMEELGDALMAQVEDEVRVLPSPQREHRSWLRLFEYAAANREYYITMFGKQGSVLLNQRMMDYLARAHEANIRSGVYSVMIDLPPTFLAQYIVGAVWRLVMWWLETTNNYTAEQMADMLYRMIFRRESE
jgi:AcrR family transcriptional regulator